MTGSLAGQTFTQDVAGTLYGCHVNFYGGGGFLTTPSLPDLTRHEEHTPYTGGCTAPGTLVVTLHGYDNSGVPITNTDGDNHLGCTSGSTTATPVAQAKRRRAWNWILPRALRWGDQPRR